MFETKQKNERGVLVAVGAKSASDEHMTELMDELAFLSQTLQIDVINHFFQKLEHPDSRTFVGKGKLEEIKTYCKVEKIDVIISMMTSLLLNCGTLKKNSRSKYMIGVF